MTDNQSLRTNLLARRFAALLYDSALLAALLLFASIPPVLLNHGEAFVHGDPRRYVYVGWLLLVSFFYFGWSWTHGGQTLGMKSWRLRVRKSDGSGLSWTAALLRFVLAIFCLVPLAGLGLLSMLLSRDRAAAHDRLSGTFVQILPRN